MSRFTIQDFLPGDIMVMPFGNGRRTRTSLFVRINKQRSNGTPIWTILDDFDKESDFVIYHKSSPTYSRDVRIMRKGEIIFQGDLG